MANPFANSKTKAPLPKPTFWVVMGCLVAVIVVATYFNNLSVGAREAHTFLRTMPVDQIREIRIEPYAVSSLTDHVMVIKDPERVARIAAVFRAMTPVSLDHPAANWVAIIRFQLDGREYGGRIEATSNQGGLFLMASRVQGGRNYGAYRNDDLGALFEGLVAAEKSRK